MDSFFGIGPLELVFILIFALIFLGPERFPTVIRQIGRYLAQLRALSQEISEQLNEELGDLDELNPQKQLTELLNPPASKTQKKEQKTRPTKQKPAKPATPPKSRASGSSETITPAVTDNLPGEDGDQPGPEAEQKQLTSPASAQIAEHLARREREQKLQKAALEEQETANSIAPPELLQNTPQTNANSTRPAEPEQATPQESPPLDGASSNEDDSGEEQA